MIPISEWDFDTKYDLLGTPERQLHQTTLLRADTHDILYVLVAMMFFYFAFELCPIYHPTLRYVSAIIGLAVLLWGVYKHFQVRIRLMRKFEHQSTIVENGGKE